MPNLHHLRLAIISASLLLPFAVSCGEIELPTSQETLKQEEPTTPSKGDDSSNEGTDKNPDSPKDNPNDGDDNPDTPEDNPNDGNPDAPEDNPFDDSGDLHFGRATLTADGHIVIDGKLYLSLIEYRDIRGAEAATANSIAKSYVEGTLTGWRVPTLDDVKILTDVLTSETAWYKGSPMALLNWALEESELTNYDQLPLREGDGTVSIYFLCDGGKKAYTFDAYASTQITQITAKKKYRLRLVKDK